ncbi:MAG: M23 family metallopeptidase [Kofleriaceae bacterium]
MATAVCPRCARVVRLHEGRPFITASGDVELWHRECREARLLPTLADPVFLAPPPPSRHKHWLIGAGAAASAALVVIAITQWTWAVSTQPVASAVPDPEVIQREPLTVPARTVVKELTPPTRERTVTAISDQHAVPDHASGVPLDEAFYTLRGWLHPISGVDGLLPITSQGGFGAERQGIERTECGRGHCGVDLHGPRGRGIIAVATGVVVRVELRRDGGDGMSGRYVKLRHEDGSTTAYMHLDSVDNALEPGDTVYAGQFLGTLGSTGVAANAPHLHFALELPKDPDRAGEETLFVDPAPFLARSKISPIVSRGDLVHAVKPAF